MSSWPNKRRNTIRDLQAAKDHGDKWAMLTCYDATTAAIFDDADVRVLLVGDSAAMTVLGYDSTLPITLDQMITFAGAVVRGSKRALVVGDLPFGSFQASPRQAVESSMRYFKEAEVQAVKLEGGTPVVDHVKAIVDSGMPVMGHLGLTPQSVNALGGFRVQGRGDAGERLLEEAKSLESAGAFAVVLEAVPAELAERVTKSLTIPTIGIGAGLACDAQVLVWQDMAGLTQGHIPKFVKQYGQLGSTLSEIASTYVRDVADGHFPSDEHTYGA